MNEVLSQTFGRPGKPGSVEVTYMSGLRYGCSLLVRVGFPGKGGRGGPAVDQTDDVDADPPFVDRGGAGGGHANAPILEALIAYAESRKGTRDEPLCFLKPGDHQAEWPYHTPMATMVQIGPGGGGGGAAGDIMPGEDGEDGLLGATFIIPTYLPLQRPRESDRS